MSPPHLFLDTSAIVHGKPLDQIDWPKLVGTEEVVLVIPTTVLNELNEHKDSSAGKVKKKRAQRFFSWLKAQNDPLQPCGFEIRSSVRCRVLAAEPKMARHGDLDPSVKDDRIVAECLDFPWADSYRLVTQDWPLRLKARAHGLNATCLPDELLLPEERDESDELRRELTALKDSRPALTAQFFSGSRPSNLLTVPIRLFTPITEEEIRARLESAELEAQVRRVREFDAGPFDSDVTGNVEVLRSYVRAHRQFLKDFNHVNSILGRTIEIEISIANDGRGPARRIDVVLEALPADIELESISAVPALPVPPLEPDGTLFILHAPAEVASHAGDSPGDPKVQDGVLRYDVGDLTHGDSRQLGRFAAVVPEGWSRDGFQLRAQIRTWDLPQPVRIDLHVRTTVSSESGSAELDRWLAENSS